MGLETADPFTPDAGELDPRLDHSIGRQRYSLPRLARINDSLEKLGSVTSQTLDLTRLRSMLTIKSDKGSLQDNTSWTPGYTAINYTIIRFADVLLMAAEAEIEVGSPEKARDLC